MATKADAEAVAKGCRFAIPSTMRARPSLPIVGELLGIVVVYMGESRYTATIRVAFLGSSISKNSLATECGHGHTSVLGNLGAQHELRMNWKHRQRPNTSPSDVRGGDRICCVAMSATDARAAEARCFSHRGSIHQEPVSKRTASASTCSDRYQAIRQGGRTERRTPSP